MNLATVGGSILFVAASAITEPTASMITFLIGTVLFAIPISHDVIGKLKFQNPGIRKRFFILQYIETFTFFFGVILFIAGELYFLLGSNPNVGPILWIIGSFFFTLGSFVSIISLQFPSIVGVDSEPELLTPLPVGITFYLGSVLFVAGSWFSLPHWYSFSVSVNSFLVGSCLFLAGSLFASFVGFVGWCLSLWADSVKSLAELILNAVLQKFD